jgi:Cdc6-like AAA superfamily ATPase
MSIEGSIPPSIRDALDSKSGYVIVVTGKPGTGKTLYVQLVSLDTLENKFGITDVKGMIAEITASLPSTNRATISILGEQQGLKSGSIAYSIHLRVQELNGVLSVCGVNPRTNYLAVRLLLSKGFLDYELVPIV